MSDERTKINCLVIGKAKTGTTALARLLQTETMAPVLHMEPKGIRDILGTLDNGQSYVTKIIFEHFRGRYRHLNAIIHNELYAQYDKVVFIKRDLRDEMLSRLLYLSKVLAGANHSKDKWQRWIEALQDKEHDPSSISFKELCLLFQEIFAANAWRDITGLHTQTEREFLNFMGNSVKRDHYILKYEDMIDNQFDELSEYLGFPVTHSTADIEMGPWSYTKRSAGYGGWRRFFLESDIEEIRDILKRRKLDDFEDWDLEPVSSLPASDFSEYVARQLNMKVTPRTEEVSPAQA